MWMFLAPAPRPNASHWPGRRMFALIDALIWPAALAVGVALLPIQTGAFGPMALAACSVAAVRRAWRALMVNHRYRFTTASGLGQLAVLLMMAATLKIAA